MDNHSAFIKNQYAKKELENQELSILIRANIIIVSSCKLKKVLCERYGDEFSEKIEVIRNGYDGQIIKEENKDIPVKNDFTITYFGTISSWFNFKYLEDSLNEIKGIRYKLIGPVSDVVIPDIEGIDYIGTIEHDKLYEEIKNDDCLFMPFKVNEIIESVDPVKLYEYINMGKNIISVSYPEILRFEPFVYFYSDYNSYIEQIYKLMNNNRMKYSQSERLIFLKNNSWSNRVESINKLFLDYERSLEVDHERKEN